LLIPPSEAAALKAVFPLQFLGGEVTTGMGKITYKFE
jgi:hypothetical protein